MAIFDDFAAECYAAKGKGKKINQDVYTRTADKLVGAVGKVVPPPVSYDAPTNLLRAKLENNLHAFSAAKTLTEYQEMTKLLSDPNGKLRTFGMFRDEVAKLNPLFNEDWLKTEYNTAIARSEAAMSWDKFQKNKDKFPYLIFKTQEDGGVRESHQALNNTKKAVDHPFWSTYFPPLAWNCRCYVINSDVRDGLTSEKDAWKAGREAKVQPLFKNNPGQTEMIFSADHPYFQNAGKINELDAVKNYGMRDWAKIQRQMANEHQPVTRGTEKDYKDWWAAQVKVNGVGGDNFQATDIRGNKILFDAGNKKANFREHVSKRFDIATHSVDIIKSPDEMWSFHDPTHPGNPVVHTYIKYHKEDVLTVIVREKDGVLKAETMYNVTSEKTFNNQRKGVLMHSNKKWNNPDYAKTKKSGLPA